MIQLAIQMHQFLANRGHYALCGLGNSSFRSGFPVGCIGAFDGRQTARGYQWFIGLKWLKFLYCWH